MEKLYPTSSCMEKKFFLVNKLTDHNCFYLVQVFRPFVCSLALGLQICQLTLRCFRALIWVHLSWIQLILALIVAQWPHSEMAFGHLTKLNIKGKMVSVKPCLHYTTFRVSDVPGRSHYAILSLRSGSFCVHTLRLDDGSVQTTRFSQSGGVADCAVSHLQLKRRKIGL